MEYRRLGRTDIKVSVICLGSMTWGEQNSEAEGHQQLDYALDHGVNFVDTAELYAIPPRAETYGRTEEIIGNWLEQTGRREEVILASKVVGRGGEWISHIRGGQTRLDRHNIVKALDGSLKRLKTDYIDLYQLHWPDRHTNFFGKRGYEHDPNDLPVPIVETLSILDDQVKAGKIRHVGLSNETPWGAMKFIQLTETLGLPRVVSVQNPYNLLNRIFEVGLAEVAHREQTGLLAYSPLGFGVLSGKYLEGHPEGARLTRWPDYDRYSNPQAIAATREYVALAREHGLDPAQMALAFVNSRPFLTSNIIGATTMEQLKSNIESAGLALPPEVLEGIEAIHSRYPNPSP
ncbi:NADP(H)-dependent aldo-keto reductase [Thiohalomonas denitrificans]|uniref:Protein tas n=1 Tax=Thiohalomonas denitrificans TaxID=415747 RepID=A0A1G5PRJ3_9GAMM|nr:NADP(H)-dependent aldo-keto reductase [Thiohalomonas denitrificans]SCZ52062.1 Predicted oxidoreductase [Thiohalomonas denitrificans]